MYGYDLLGEECCNIPSLDPNLMLKNNANLTFQDVKIKKIVRPFLTVPN